MVSRRFTFFYFLVTADIDQLFVWSASFFPAWFLKLMIDKRDVRHVYVIMYLFFISRS